MKIIVLVLSILAQVCATAAQPAQHPYTIVTNWLADSAESLFSRKGSNFTFFQFFREWNIATRQVWEKKETKQEERTKYGKKAIVTSGKFFKTAGEFTSGVSSCIGKQILTMRYESPEKLKITDNAWNRLHNNVQAKSMSNVCAAEKNLENIELIKSLNAAVDRVIECIFNSHNRPQYLTHKSIARNPYATNPNYLIFELEALYSKLESVISELLTSQDTSRTKGLASMFARFLRQKRAHIMEAHSEIAERHFDIAMHLHDFLHIKAANGGQGVMFHVLDALLNVLSCVLKDYLQPLTQGIRQALEQEVKADDVSAYTGVYSEIVRHFGNNTGCKLSDALNPFVEYMEQNCATVEGVQNAIELALNYKDTFSHRRNIYGLIHRELQEILPQIKQLRDNVQYVDLTDKPLEKNSKE